MKPVSIPEFSEWYVSINRQKGAEYYPNSSVIVTVTAFTTITQDIILTAKPTGNITGMVTNK